MTAIPETRHTPPNDKGESKPYRVLMPMHLASDAAFNDWFAIVLREFLHRQGITADHIGNDELIKRVRNTFGNHNARRGPVTSAVPVQLQE